MYLPMPCCVCVVTCCDPGVLEHIVKLKSRLITHNTSAVCPQPNQCTSDVANLANGGQRSSQCWQCVYSTSNQYQPLKVQKCFKIMIIKKKKKNHSSGCNRDVELIETNRNVSAFGLLENWTGLLNSRYSVKQCRRNTVNINNGLLCTQTREHKLTAKGNSMVPCG